MHLPPGAAAMLSSVTPCPEPQVAAGTCGPESLIGHSTATAGPGRSPFTVGGRVFLTGPYKGAPFGLSVVTPAVAGPFNLGNVIVRSTINVDPNTAAVTITSDPFPTIIKGVPVQLKQINVTIDRPNFQFNPTNCNPMSITGTLSGAQGGAEAVSSALPGRQLRGAALQTDADRLHAGQLEQSQRGEPDRQGHLDARAGEHRQNRADPADRAALAADDDPESVHVAGVQRQPGRLPEGSNIGTATVHTPVLKSPLSGPAYLVSHGSAAFPDVEFVLQGEGITLILDGQTDIKKASPARPSTRCPTRRSRRLKRRSPRVRTRR